MAVNNVLLLFQGTGYIVALMLSLCVVIPLGLNVENFKGHCLLFTTGSFGDDGNFNADWASKGYCGYILFVSCLLVLVSIIQAIRMFSMLRKETDSSFLSAFLDCIMTILFAIMVFVASILVTLGFKTWCDAVTQRFRSCDDASIMEISKADNVQTKGFFIQIGTVQFGIWSSWVCWVLLAVLSTLKLCRYHEREVIRDSNITSRLASVGRKVGYQVSSEFLLSPIWQNSENSEDKLLKLELLKPSLLVSSTMHSTEGVNRHWSKLDNLSYPPIYIHWNHGIVKKVYVLPDSRDMINIKKGIASLFQIRLVDANVKEHDVSGICNVRYRAHGTTIKKRTKQLLTPTVKATSDMIINLSPQESIIQTVSGKEEVRMTLNLWKQAAVFVKSKVHLNFIEHYGSHSTHSGKNVGVVLKSIAEEMGSKFRAESLEAKTEENTCVNCRPIKELIHEYGANLLPEYLGELKSAGGFLKFLDSFRRASKKELLMIFKETDRRILTQLLDVLAAANTDEALDVAFELIDFESKDIGAAERFLLSLATSPNPTESTVSKTMKLLSRNIRNEKLKATVLIALASLTRTYCASNATHINSLIVQNVNKIFVRGLQECKHVGCIINHLLALRNIALPQNLPILVEYVKQGGFLGLMALEAMQDIGEQHFNQDIKQVLFRVYNQFWPHQESAARVLAAELLMKSNATAETIGEIIVSLSKPEYPEIKTLVLGKIYNLMQENSGVRSCIKDLLRNSTFWNYHNLAQNGTSSSVINELQDTQDANITYGINVEMRPTGVLKRTSFDLNLQGDNENAHLMSMSLFVEGFGQTDEEQKENPQEHSAGMQLSILGVHLRPYIFFTGTGELMGLIWSGAGNHPNPAVQV
ncbi:microsomal triglyceride transfer protein large subunit [Trichonephila clavipes]|uniref:Microsomal triglyceride transfer protein large subunit n=1 Tax=Trichonephila clavipes TaxID=2585209 RepID=A0A8X6RA84_TRICX|nr:microsomal triglyceride transfer protein large subunit [Trichonephila clavipes]